MNKSINKLLTKPFENDYVLGYCITEVMTTNCDQHQ